MTLNDVAMFIYVIVHMNDVYETSVGGDQAVHGPLRRRIGH